MALSGFLGLSQTLEWAYARLPFTIVSRPPMAHGVRAHTGKPPKATGGGESRAVDAGFSDPLSFQPISLVGWWVGPRSGSRAALSDENAP